MVNIKKNKKNAFPVLFFSKVMLLWQISIVEIDHGLFRVFAPYSIGKSLGTFFSFSSYFDFGLLSETPMRPCMTLVFQADTAENVSLS